MPALTLPLTFTNSFWSQDYRRGLETLYAKLEQGIEEDEEIVNFIRARAITEKNYALTLTNPSLTGPQGAGFGADDGASLFMAFRGLQHESVVQGEKHMEIAKELESLVADPFEQWAAGHKDRIRGSRHDILDNWLKAYEFAQNDVEHLKRDYLSKTRKADEAEDDAKFAPNNDLNDKYTASPRLAPRNPQRSATVSERIAQRLKDLQKKTSPATAETKSVVFESQSPQSETHDEEKPLPSVDKGKGKAPAPPSPDRVESPAPLSPPLPPSKLTVPSGSPMSQPLPILLAGLSLAPAALSALLKRAAAEMPLRPVKFPILGEYQDCFSGEEFATWLTESVQGLGGSLDRAEDAARELTERDGLLRRIGELGNKFENSDEAFYQFRAKAFDLEHELTKSSEHTVESPTIPNFAPMADNLVKRSNTFVNLVTKALNVNNSSEPFYVRARADAEGADKAYRVAVRKLDRQRLGLEERIEETLKVLQRWEADRLRAVKTALLQYQGTLKNLPAALQPSLDRSSTLLAAYQPESDLKALMERYRTGPFRPAPQVYESITHDESDVMFGIDLRKWAEGGWNDVRNGEAKDQIPEAVTALLNALSDAYTKLPDDVEKRKTWIYEVPLKAVHHLRESINTVAPGKSIPAEMLSKYDAPVLASGLKLWALELDPPLCTWEGWDDIRRVYPAVGATATEEQANGQQHLQDLQVALQRLPKVHLLVLDALVSHLKTLIDSTTVDESFDVYATKLALSMGRTLLRPKVETEMSIQDRHPTLLFIDLLKHYSDILPPTIARKKRESDRRVPIRKRTAPVDLRMSRSRLSVGADAHELLAAQLAAKNPNLRASSRTSSPASSDRAKAETPAPAPAPEPTATSAAAEKVELTLPAVTETKEQAPPAEDPNVPPPRPTFKEPLPDLDDAPLPMPRFATPPPETDEKQPEIPPPPTIVPATPTPPVTTPAAGAVDESSPAPRSASPTSPDVIVGDRQTTLSRSSSGEASRGLRGPRMARGPRPQSSAGGSVQSMVAGLNRNTSPGRRDSSIGSRLNRASIGSRPTSLVNPHDYEPKKKGGKAQAGAFSRRTMASDAEDEVVEK